MKVELINMKQEMFQFEKKAREKLLATTYENRAEVFEDVYTNFYKKFGEHMSNETSEVGLAKKLSWHLLLFSPLVKEGGNVLELGCGQAILLRQLAKSGVQCVGLDTHVRETDTELSMLSYVQGDAVRPDLDQTFDLVYSDQMIEHLHPDDVPLHFTAVRKLLKEDGIYAFGLPSSLVGPSDISRYFGCFKAEGLHLKEWQYHELWPILKKAGFITAKSLLINPKLTAGRCIYVSISSKIIIERVVSCLPRKIRKILGKVLLLNIFIWAQ